MIASHLYEILSAIKTAVDTTVTDATVVAKVQSEGDLDKILTDSNKKTVVYITIANEGPLVQPMNSFQAQINTVRITIFIFAMKAINVDANIKLATDLEEDINNMLKNIDLTSYNAGKCRFVSSEFQPAYPHPEDTTIKLSYDLIVKKDYRTVPVVPVP